MFGLDRIIGTDSEPYGPKEDLYKDPEAEVGDVRIKTVRKNELFNNEYSENEFIVVREKFEEKGVFQNGNKYYSWCHDRTLFQGTRDEWNDIKDSPSEIMMDIPSNWSVIVDHTERFLQYLDNPKKSASSVSTKQV